MTEAPVRFLVRASVSGFKQPSGWTQNKASSKSYRTVHKCWRRTDSLICWYKIRLLCFCLEYMVIKQKARRAWCVWHWLVLWNWTHGGASSQDWLILSKNSNRTCCSHESERCMQAVLWCVLVEHHCLAMSRIWPESLAHLWMDEI